MKNEIILSVLEDVRKQLLGVSDDFLSVGIDSPYFDDSCKVASAGNKICRLIFSLKYGDKYVKD